MDGSDYYPDYIDKCQFISENVDKAMLPISINKNGFNGSLAGNFEGYF